MDRTIRKMAPIREIKEIPAISCAHCAHMKELMQFGKTGPACCFRPPQVVAFPAPNGVQFISIWPCVDQDMSCGQFKSRTVATQ